MEGIIWEPYNDYLEKSNIRFFMNKHGIKNYEDLIRRSISDIQWFWDAMMEDCRVEWYRKYDRTLDMGKSKSFEWAQWFIGGKINIAHNTLDRYALDPLVKNRLAFIWEGEDGSIQKWTYGDLYIEANRCANALRGLGVGKGDTVGLYMPMIPELIVAFFACLKVGAPMVPVFSGFGAAALGVRLEDAEAKVLITTDGSLRRGRRVELKSTCDEAARMVPTLKHIVVARRLGDADIPWTAGRDIWWHELVPGQSKECKTEVLDAEDYSLILFSSGTTGRPKGTMHTHAGALAQTAKEVGYSLDVKPSDRFFWVTDIGWMMGPWQIIGVQHFGSCHFIYEGAPNYPNPDRVWEMIERHQITTLGISPTLIRLLMRSGKEWVEKHDLSSLRILGSTGEPWDSESYMWFFNTVGKRRLPIMNISGGTEMVGCLLQPYPVASLKPCTLRGPGLAMDIDVFDDDGKPIRGGIGHLVCKQPCPSFTKSFLKDDERYIETYFSRWPEVWYHGDWALVDEDGFWFLHGRSDDTIKVAGKRTGPAEVEAALIEHPAVSEAAAIGVPHAIKGEGVVCFVVLQPGVEPGEELRQELKGQVVKFLGKTLRPDDLKFVNALPKTRSAKIVRGTIKKKYLGEDLGDIASIENPEALDEIDAAR
ncbi:MAG: AMP-binding protein [Deltaproteobacteria bacterium]|nr:AMP-binding protein [Deltaproteobacteria bacterium]